jgi:hypothetical protein
MSIKRMDISEFREIGFLQEANRKFFHPHGLALEVVVEEDGTERLGGIWDYRDDPEGIFYEPEDLSHWRVERVRDIREKKIDRRVSRGCYANGVQGLPGLTEDEQPTT